MDECVFALLCLLDALAKDATSFEEVFQSSVIFFL